MKKRFFIASWSGDTDRGIYSFLYDFDKAEASTPVRCAEINHASYFACYGDILYAISENPGPGEFAGELHSFSIGSNGLEPIDSVGGVLSGAPHISVSDSGRLVFVCSYDSGMTCSVETDKGHFGNITGAVRITGSSVVPGRQETPHAHIMCNAPDGYIVCCDLGTDELISYLPDSSDGSLSVVNRMKVPAGYGPRHMVFSRDGAYAYVVCELQYHLLTFSYLGEGRLALLRDDKILPSLPEGSSWGGAIKLSSDGSLLFTSNRPEGMSSIDIFSLSRPEAPSLLSSSNLCNHPRDFLLTADDSGKEYLICLSMTDNLIRVFSFDRNTASFSFLTEISGIPKPVCIVEY